MTSAKYLDGVKSVVIFIFIPRMHKWQQLCFAEVKTKSQISNREYILLKQYILIRANLALNWKYD